MERDGLIKRTKHPEDARAQQIWLTNKAKRIKDDAYRSAWETNKQALTSLNEIEKDQFIQLMQKVIGSMQS